MDFFRKCNEWLDKVSLLLIMYLHSNVFYLMTRWLKINVKLMLAFRLRLCIFEPILIVLLYSGNSIHTPYKGHMSLRTGSKKQSTLFMILWYCPGLWRILATLHSKIFKATEIWFKIYKMFFIPYLFHILPLPITYPTKYICCWSTSNSKTG